MHLRSCPVDMEVDVIGVGLPESVRLRFGELGLRIGSRVRVMQNCGIGGRVVAIGGVRLAIDGTTAAGVEVRAAT